MNEDTTKEYRPLHAGVPFDKNAPRKLPDAVHDVISAAVRKRKDRSFVRIFVAQAIRGRTLRGCILSASAALFTSKHLRDKAHLFHERVKGPMALSALACAIFPRGIVAAIDAAVWSAPTTELHESVRDFCSFCRVAAYEAAYQLAKDALGATVDPKPIRRVDDPTKPPRKPRKPRQRRGAA